MSLTNLIENVLGCTKIKCTVGEKCLSQNVAVRDILGKTFAVSMSLAIQSKIIDMVPKSGAEITEILECSWTHCRDRLP